MEIVTQKNISYDLAVAIAKFTQRFNGQSGLSVRNVNTLLSLDVEFLIVRNGRQIVCVAFVYPLKSETMKSRPDIKPLQEFGIDDIVGLDSIIPSTSIKMSYLWIRTTNPEYIRDITRNVGNCYWVNNSLEDTDALHSEKITQWSFSINIHITKHFGIFNICNCPFTKDDGYNYQLSKIDDSSIPTYQIKKLNDQKCIFQILCTPMTNGSQTMIIGNILFVKFNGKADMKCYLLIINLAETMGVDLLQGYGDQIPTFFNKSQKYCYYNYNNLHHNENLLILG